MSEDQPFIGLWDVVRQERRIHGKWVREYDFEPGEWIAAFFAEGRHSEIFRPTGMREEITACDWVYDASSGIISLYADEEPKELVRSVAFDAADSDRGGYAFLYRFDDSPHIHPDSGSVADHFAYLRISLVKPVDVI